MLSAVVGVWVLIITVVMPGRPPLVHEAANFVTVEACESFKAQLEAAFQENLRRAQQRKPATAASPLSYPRTSACVEGK
jgi:hypothetical protein